MLQRRRVISSALTAVSVLELVHSEARATGRSRRKQHMQLSDGFRPPGDSIRMQGVFKNFNTIEEFKDVEAKKKLFNELAESVSR